MFLVPLVLCFLLLFVHAFEKRHSTSDVISCDIVIIGGGSSGTYAAIRLFQQNKSVALIEKKPVLGGHVDTYRDPDTDATFDYGVISFDNITVVNDYFEYFDIPLTPAVYGSSESHYADFKTGDIVTVPASVPWTNSTAQGLAIAAYGAQLEKYPFLPNGYSLPSRVPEDLLMTYGDFLDKYDLQALAYTAFTFIQGVGNILAQPTLYIMKYFALVTVEAILGTGPNFMTTAHHNNHELYEKALAKLGSSAFVSSNVTSITRSGSDNCSVEVSFSTPSGPKLVKASQLLIAIQPTLENLQSLNLDLDEIETTLFGKFNNSYYWDMVIRNSGLPENSSFANVDLSAPLALPAMPALYSIGPTGLPGLSSAYYSSPYYVSDDHVKSDVLTTLAKIAKVNGYESNGTTPEFAGFNNHAPFELTVSVEEVKNGFYDKVNGLQGKKSTWWTGATWQAHDSSQIWNWTEYTLLPKLIASL